MLVTWVVYFHKMVTKNLVNVRFKQWCSVLWCFLGSMAKSYGFLWGCYPGRWAGVGSLGWGRHPGGPSLSWWLPPGSGSVWSSGRPTPGWLSGSLPLHSGPAPYLHMQGHRETERHRGLGKEEQNLTRLKKPIGWIKNSICVHGRTHPPTRTHTHTFVYVKYGDIA